jgi:two-component system response regulator
MATSEIISQFGAAVRRLRHDMDISQAKLAERAGLHQTYIAGIECGGRNVTLKNINKLACALQVSTATLLMANDAPGRPSADAYVDILMVEDNRDDEELTLRAFQQARITNSVRVVRDGREALDFLFCAGRFSRRKAKDRPQMVLLDLMLPQISGMEVLRRIKTDERTRSIPVVVLTASQDTEKLAECQRLGADTYIVKPVDLQRLGTATPRLNLNWALLKPPEATVFGIGEGSQSKRSFF